jgi:nicotinamidase-related amidase
MQPMLQQRGIKTVIVCGASSNQAVMYTATAAVRPFGYTRVIPVMAEKFWITEFDKIV